MVVWTFVVFVTARWAFQFLYFQWPGAVAVVGAHRRPHRLYGEPASLSRSLAVSSFVSSCLNDQLPLLNLISNPAPLHPAVSAWAI